ncbi:hypothetical protein AAFF_G00113360 [Aldrovandia affinis]|uniref:DUF4806 domain-containing protein n=1 Tax=Aldrovandia affinis TaxID=143900 RepID=A0AAD7RT44_9TELE|nr:hypothetical protein AAFF_G00113360 [Aldrovandia affinis]
MFSEGINQHLGKSMDHGNPSHRKMRRHVDTLVKKHMTSIALETLEILQQRLKAVSQDLNDLDENGPEAETDASDLDENGPDTHVEAKTESYIGSRNGPEEPNPSQDMATQREILSLLHEIKEEQQRQWTVLRALQTSMQMHQVEPIEIELPIRSMEHLDEVERRLGEPREQTRMISRLSVLGGTTVDVVVRNIMTTVLSVGVACLLNWAGHGHKRSFRVTRLQEVLFRAFRSNPVGRDTTHKQFADVIKKWLRYAPGRQKKGRRRIGKPSEELIFVKLESED